MLNRISTLLYVSICGAAFAAASFLLSPLAPIERSDARLGETDGLVMLAGVPFTGTLRERHLTGRLRTETQYKAGLKHGTELSFHNNGRIVERRRYRAGARDGLQESWYATGERFGEMTYAADTPVGTTREWHVNGRLKKEERLENGASVATKLFYQTGEIHSNYVIRDGRTYGLVAEAGCLPRTDELKELTP